MTASAPWRTAPEHTERVSFRCSAEVRNRLGSRRSCSCGPPSAWVRLLVEKALDELESAAMSTRFRHYLQSHLCGHCRAAHGWCPTCSEPWDLDLSDAWAAHGPIAGLWAAPAAGQGSTSKWSALRRFPPALIAPCSGRPLSDHLQALERALAKVAPRDVLPRRNTWERLIWGLELPSTQMLLRQHARLVGANSDRLLIAVDPRWLPMVRARQALLERSLDDGRRVVLVPSMGVSAPVAPPPPPRPKKRQSHRMQPHHLERLRSQVAAQAVSPYVPCPAGVERRTLREWVAAGEPITAAPAAVAAAYKRRFGRSPRKQGQMATYFPARAADRSSRSPLD